MFSKVNLSLVFFIYVLVCIIMALIMSFSRGSLRAHTIIHFNIVWRYTYSIRLFLIEAKHSYKGKHINRKHTTKIFKVQ